MPPRRVIGIDTGGTKLLGGVVDDRLLVHHRVYRLWHGKERGEVLDTFRWGLAERREIDALEFTRAGDQVVVGARGSSITGAGEEPLEGQIFNVFTLRDGQIVRIDDYRHRGEALAAAGVAEGADWR